MSVQFEFVECPKDVECMVCLDPWVRDPIELRPCQHTLCRACVASLGTCPICRTVIKTREVPSRTLINLAATVVRVKCLRCAEWEGTFEDSSAHSKVCAAPPPPPPPPLAATGARPPSPTTGASRPADEPFPWVRLGISQQDYDRTLSVFLTFASDSGASTPATSTLDPDGFQLLFRTLSLVMPSGMTIHRLYDQLRGEAVGVTFAALIDFMLHSLGRDEESQHAELSRAAARRDAEALKNRGNDCFVRKRFEDALRHYSDAETLLQTRVTPSTFGDEELLLLCVIHCNISSAHHSLLSFDAAWNSANVATEVRPSRGKAFWCRARAAEGLGWVDAAVKDFVRALELGMEVAQIKPTDSAVQEQLYASCPQWAASRPAPSSSSTPSSPSSPHVRVADAAKNAGRIAEAIAEYERAISVTPSRDNSTELGLLHCEVASCYFKLGRYADAVKACNTALSVDENCVRALVRRALTFEKANDPRSALESFLEARDRDGAKNFDHTTEDGIHRCRGQLRR